MKRRDFVSKVVAAGVGAAVTTSATSQDTPTGQLARRKYGKDGPDISIIGFGAIVVSDIELINVEGEGPKCHPGRAWPVLLHEDEAVQVVPRV